MQEFQPIAAGLRPASATIAQLRAARALLPESARNAARKPLGFASVDRILGGGLRCGTLHEIFAEPGHEACASAFAATLGLRVAKDKRVLWIRQDFSALEAGEVAATGLLELGIDPGQLLLLRLGQACDVLRAACDALTCPALGMVVMEISGNPKVLDLAASRRLTLACAQKGVTTILLRMQAKTAPSAAETRWRVKAARSSPKNESWGNPVFETDLVRNRQGRTGHWVMEWSCDDGLFREPCDTASGWAHGATYPGALVSASCDRSPASALEGAESLHAIRRTG